MRGTHREALLRFEGQFDLQFVSHIATGYTTRDWVELADLACQKGFHQIWVTDNAGYRAPLVVLTAIAAQVPIHVGHAVLVPYYHQPLDLAGSLAALSELCQGREIGVGLARGSLAHTGHHVQVIRPLGMVREFARFLKLSLQGERLAYRDFPVICDYYHLNRKGHFSLTMKPASPFCFYGGGGGPKALQETGKTMDGLISGGTFLSLLRTGRQQDLLRIAEESAQETQDGKTLRKMCEVNVSISRDRDAALGFPKSQVAQAALQWEMLGFTDEEYDRLSVDRRKVLKIKERFAGGATIEEVAALVDEDMIQAGYIAGQPEEVIEEIQLVCRQAAEMGYDQVAFAKLGPDYHEAIQLLSERIMPELE